ncbi:uncharacterized protein LOC128996503 isoform X2 [Macrosteles quadrilineatus]|nr:uncharacterized protein LOC128996503 isoform X2 [Macrosteles quadrilineatus]
MTGLEVCGHVDVKVPSKGRKFGVWKAWRQQWCIVRCGQDRTIQMVLGHGHNSPTSCIVIPYNAVLCRSESRSRPYAFGVFCSSSVTRFRQPIVFLAARSETQSQNLMLKIRNLISKPKIPVEPGLFSVSLIDNTHSRTAGLAGLYGTLSTSLTGITVGDPATGQIKVHWRWPQVDRVSLAPVCTPEDKGHVVILHTSSEFSCGEGELRLFCLQGSELDTEISKFLSKPQHRLTSSPLPPLPHPSPALLASRRLSRSEGDLRCWPQDSNFSLFHLRTQSMSRNTSNDKVASSLIHAGLGLMLTTPGCSEPDSLHDYQCLDSYWPEPDTLGDLPNLESRRAQFRDGRRESGVSIASGIYEEIDENDYESMRPQVEDPPPLPPRKHEPSGSEEEYSTPDLIYSVAEDKEEEEEEPLYLPMSPGNRKEDTYVVMANLINKNHISEPVL